MKLDPDSFGRELGEITMHLIRANENEIHSVVGGDDALFLANLVVLMYWITTWRFSEILPKQIARPTLDAMHQWMYVSLAPTGLAHAELERFVNDRYAQYYDALRTHDGADALRHIAAGFIGYCHFDGHGCVRYSMDELKVFQVFTQMMGHAHAMQGTLLRMLEGMATTP